MPTLLRLSLIALAVLGTAAPSALAAKRMRFDLRSKVTNAKLIDAEPVGKSAGDILIFTEDLFGEGSAVVGHDAAYCVQLFDATALCSGVYSLKGGQIMVQLLQPGPTGTYTQSVTGGTGRYARATGTVTVRQDPAKGDRFHFDVRTP
jgi:hypothetical protein